MNVSELIIILDAGHGCNTNGKRSVDNSIHEWMYVRELRYFIAQRLRRKGFEVRYVHVGDDELEPLQKDLAQRVNEANAINSIAKARGKRCIFISLHLDAIGDGSTWQAASGATPFISPSAGATAKLLASCYASQIAAHKFKGNRCYNSHRTGDFYVLNRTNMPAVLIEHFFMTNKEEVSYFDKLPNKMKLAMMHEDAIMNFISRI